MSCKKYLTCIAGASLLLVLFNSAVIFVQLRDKVCFIGENGPLQVSLTHKLAGDIDKYTSQLIAGIEPDLPPINLYGFPYSIPNKEKCLLSNGQPYNIHLLLIVRTGLTNAENRTAIRNTWGREDRFSGLVIRCIFNLGSKLDDPDLQQQILDEHLEHGDIIQSSFVDNYYNSTIKTMMGLRWVMEYCPTAKYVMFVDDDMYVSVKNLLRYINRPEGYPTYLNYSDVEVQVKDSAFQFDVNHSPTYFYSGYAKHFDHPQRGSEKWSASFDEYPYSIYPPYVPGGAFILSFSALRKMYYTSMYTPHYKYDDVYLGMVAKRAGIVPMHNDNFVVEKNVSKLAYNFSFKDVIVHHGYSSENLIQVWNEQFYLKNT